MIKTNPRLIPLIGDWRLMHLERGIDIPARVPGSLFEDLIDHGIIPDPFFGVNEQEMQWVFESTWEYQLLFDLPEGWWIKDDFALTFMGIDTFATVMLNDHKIGIAQNMHREYEFVLSDPSILKQKHNRLIIRFDSAVEKARTRWEEDGSKRWNMVDTLPGIHHLRKAQYAFGWDWGPKLPDMGLWRGVYLHMMTSPRLDGLRYRADYEYEAGVITRAHMKASFEVDSIEDHQALTFSFQVIGPQGETVVEEEGPIEQDKTSFKIRIDNPQLWWTHDLGQQPMYQLAVRLFNHGEQCDQSTLRIGLRDLQLVRSPDQWGESFYFTLNGVPIFAKGANWIPPDCFIPRAIRQGKYEMILDSAKDAHMNMLRVWGGGIYEEDLFYSLCDSMGILVWQDFAFACAPTPDDDHLLIDIRQEAIDNIRRLRHHPSLCIWVGNNEVEEGWVHWGFEQLFPQWKETYLQIFEEMLPSLVHQHDPERPYWPSSPSSGGNFTDTQSPDRGDSHYWRVWHDQFPFTAYRDFPSRFMSEFGFESFPSMKTIRSFCPEDQFHMHSEVMEAHQKNPAGNKKIMYYMEQRFHVPQSFDKQVILSQITQAEAMEYGVEHWRRNRNDYHCMGSLYWQLNDCWPVASWSSIDYYGRWKALHYFAKRFYAPLFISAQEQEDRVCLWVTNDSPLDKEIRVRWSLLHASGQSLVEEERTLIAPALCSNQVWEAGYEIVLKGHSREESILFYEACDQQGNRLSHGARLLGMPKAFPLTNPELSWELVQKDESKKRFSLTITAKAIGLYVWIDADPTDIWLSDNFFPMKTRETRVLELKTHAPVSLNSLKKELKVGSLFDLV